MKDAKWKKLLIALSVVVLLAVAGRMAITNVLLSPGAVSEADIATLDGDQQIITSELSPYGYPDLMVQDGVPVHWNLIASEGTLNGCNNAIIIPAYDIEISLQEGDNIIEFTPEETGEISYYCWMGMIEADISIVEELGTI